MGRNKKTPVETRASQGIAGFSQRIQDSGVSHHLTHIKQNFKYYLAGIASLITFVIYLPSLQNDFVFWDDDFYIIENPDIRSFNPAFFRWAFFGFHNSNWHPLTWISHALDYAVWGLNPMGHHLTNNFLHAANTFLVVLLAARLLESRQAVRPSSSHISSFTLITSVVTGLLFGLHPIHVESVAWVSERKDLICALFFLLSVMMYMRYVPSVRLPAGKGMGKEDSSFGGGKLYLLTLCFFVLALMSKPMAVSLPFVLLILDWYPLERIGSTRSFRTVFIEKIPFFALSIVSSILTVLAQRAGGAISSLEEIKLSSRVLIAPKILITYLWKMVLPLELYPFYPYPNDISFLSPAYLWPLALVAGITAVCLKIVKRQRLWLATWCYYSITLMPVLGIVHVGNQSMADRYTYLPSLGPFIIIGLVMAWILIKAARSRLIIRLLAAVIAVSVFVSLSYLTFKQIGIWENTFSLWTYVINKEPTGSTAAYMNRAKYFRKMGDYDKAIADLDMLLFLDPSYYDAYVWRKITVLQAACNSGNEDSCNALKAFGLKGRRK